MAAEFSPVEALVPAITLLGFGASAALVSRALRLSPIVGYLLVGILIGPGALKLIQDNQTTHLLAELGVVFLLFDIGMHVSLRELKESRQNLIRLAPTHLALTGLTSAALLWLLKVDWPIALAVGLSLGLSSTAVVARILLEREQAGCPIGRAATHVLIFQDIVAIFLIIFATSLGSDSHASSGLAAVISNIAMDGAPLPLLTTLTLSVAQALVAFAVAILAGKYLINPVFRTLVATRNSEAFTAFVLLMVLSAACATVALGLSLTLGAFLAGLAVSGTPFRHQVQSEMEPFRGLLLSFFFMSIGIGLDLNALLAKLPLILVGAVAILAIKTGLGYVAARLSGWSIPGATQLATLLAQGSEFTLVILSIGAVMSDLAPDIMSLIVAAVAVSLALAPAWADLGVKLSRKLAQRKQTEIEQPTSSASGERPVLVIGMSSAGRLAVDALIDHNIPYIATDSDPDRFLAAVSDGYRVSFGDASNIRLIDALGGSQARAIVLGQPRFEVSLEVTPTVKRKFPDLVRYVAVEEPEDLKRFLDIGVKAFMVGTEPKGIEMVADLLRTLGISNDEVANWLTRQADIHTIGDGTDARHSDKDEENSSNPVDEAA